MLMSTHLVLIGERPVSLKHPSTATSSKSPRARPSSLTPSPPSRHSPTIRDPRASPTPRRIHPGAPIPNHLRHPLPHAPRSLHPTPPDRARRRAGRNSTGRLRARLRSFCNRTPPPKARAWRLRTPFPQRGASGTVRRHLVDALLLVRRAPALVAHLIGPGAHRSRVYIHRTYRFVRRSCARSTLASPRDRPRSRDGRTVPTARNPPESKLAFGPPLGPAIHSPTLASFAAPLSACSSILFA